MSGPYPQLLSPLEVGPLTLRNRVVSTSHQTGLVEDHLPTDDLLAYHEARARGGVGAIFVEATAIDPTGLLTGHTIGGFLPEIVPLYRRLSDSVHGHGAKLFVQLLHGGREQISSSPKPPAVAPSAVPSLRFKCEPRALTLKEIEQLIDGYATSARLAAEGGLDGIEVSMSHGYLPSQFLSPLSNRRGDAYDGSLQARLRFSIEILEAVRDAVGEKMAVGVRLSADELVPGGLDVEQCAEIAARLHREGLVDLVSLVLGHSAFPAASTYIAPPPPVPANAIAAPAAAIRAAVPGLTLLTTTRVVDLAAGEALVAGGTADLVGMTRAMIADPELVAKALAGREAELIECVGCNQACIGHYHAGVPIGCAVNARTGRERTLTPRTPQCSQGGHGGPGGRGGHGGPGGRIVLVIGAGPAGAAAAIEAATAGDAVTLVERAEQLGGQLRLAGHAPAHVEPWQRYRRSTESRLRAAGVSLQLGTEGSAQLAEGFDLVVLATGARPYEPPQEIAGPAVRQAWDVIRDPGATAGPALVADWGGGWDGLDAAERLAGAGVVVTLACAAPTPGETLHQYQRNLYLARLDELGVAILHHHELADDGGRPILRHLFSGRATGLPEVATLVLAQGRVPVDALWGELESHPGAVRAGDVLSPRTLEEAVLEGTRAVADPAPPPTT
ncbi:MAG TPA: FAD-dependent oxidoreductase [Solirubrobacteraceae bacterium]|jgi:2,4-dienoyl-CoA reductase-like NADH-dependent reductase (Old Yellow Enzyme family)